MSVVPLPTPVDDLIAIQLALAALVVWLAVLVERRFHRWPWVTAGVLLLNLFLVPDHAWRLLWIAARWFHALLEGLSLWGVLILILVAAILALGDPALRHWLRRARRRGKSL